eukprot:scaffold15750_cov110-Isochrysis_galbana.AAC.1
MDYFRGEPLSRAVEAMRARGIDPESAEAKAFGRKLLSALTRACGSTILGTGFFHADPHPGNIFVLDDGRIGLIDFGQVSAFPGPCPEIGRLRLVDFSAGATRNKRLWSARASRRGVLCRFPAPRGSETSARQFQVIARLPPTCGAIPRRRYSHLLFTH